MATEKWDSLPVVTCLLMGVEKLESRVVGPKFQWSIRSLKAVFAKPWNQTAKPWLKAVYRKYFAVRVNDTVRHSLANTEETNLALHFREMPAVSDFKQGDFVRVKTKSEIEATLDPFHELKGCAFLDSMYPYCGTVQKINTKVERFLDERNYKIRSTKGLYFLDHLFCTGTAAFGRCDRRCYYFWRVEWLEPAGWN